MASRETHSSVSEHEGGKTMKAVFWEGKPFEVAVHDIPKARVINETDAVVRITSAAICGSDLHTYHGISGSSQVPWPLGHEAIGIVAKTGSRVKDVKVGDRVIVADLPAKGYFEEEPTIAPNFFTYGFGKDFGNLGGCQVAEYVRVPFADESLAQIPKGIADKEYLFIGDVWATGWTGLDFAGFQPGDRVAVFGAGPVGLLCAYSALLRGAAKVYCIDHVEARLRVAKSIGAIPINLTQGGGPAAQILKLEPNGVQRVCDCVGYENVNQDLRPQQNFIISEGIKIASVDGGIGLIGVYLAQPNTKGTPRGSIISPDITFPISGFWTKGLTMKGGAVDPKVVTPQLIELVKSGRARPGFIVSQEIPIEEAPAGYERFDKHLETKVVIRFEDGRGIDGP
ncbi:MAG: hypothetical protein Q9219_007655 [cf. Caloplaca sp. 3 TL-2023]